MDYSMPSDFLASKSSLENIDTAVYNFFDSILNIQAFTNKGLTKVPVVWLGTERVYQIKNDKDLRDSVGKLKLPLIAITRNSISRDTDFRGSHQSYYPASLGRTEVTKIIKQEKTRNFANSDENKRPILGNETGPSSNRKIVYETISIRRPTYITCMYEINIRTEYQQQMNDILMPLMLDQKNIVVIENNGFKYECFIQSDYGITNNLNSLGEEERMFTSKIQFKVLGYITDYGNNSEDPTLIRTQNAVDIIVSRERVIGNNIAGGLKTTSSNAITGSGGGGLEGDLGGGSGGNGGSGGGDENIPEDNFSLDTRSRPSDAWYSIDE